MCPRDIMSKKMFLLSRDSLDGVLPHVCNGLEHLNDISTNCSAGGNCCAESNFGKVCLSNDGLYNENVNGRLVAEQALTEPSTLTQQNNVTTPPTQVATTKLQATPINQ